MTTPTTNDGVNPLKFGMELAQSLFTLLRDFSIFGVIGALVVNPGCMKEKLKDAGITQINAGFVTWENDTAKAKEDATAAATSLDTIKTSNEKLQVKLDKLAVLAKDSADPMLAKAVTEIREEAKDSSAALKVAETKLTTSIAVQDSALRQADSNDAKRTGWIYLGKVDAKKHNWVGGASTDALFPMLLGRKIELTKDVYLRGDATKKEKRSEAPILGGLESGEKAKILKVDSDRGLPGGFAVWAEVEIP